MATCLKRSSKPLERLQQHQRGANAATTTGSRSRRAAATGSGEVPIRRSTREAAAPPVPALRELICPVCRTILREPVTLPCAHNLCLGCLRGTVEHSSLSCPLCRQRVGSWLRHRTRPESLINAELWQLIRTRYPQELAAAIAADNSGAGSSSVAAAAAAAADSEEVARLDPEFSAIKILSATGEIRREYEAQLQQEEEEMKRQREKERLASEALIQKIQEEEEQQKLVQLAQDQLLAKTLAKQDVVEKTNDKYEHSSRSSTLVNSDKKKTNVNQSKSANQKMSVKSKDATDTKKQNVALISKIRSERYSTTVKANSTTAQKESSETVSSQKSVPIHNPVTRVVTHQTRVNQPNNATYPAALETVVGSTSKIYGLQSKEELHVPSDVLSNKKKKLGVEVCVTTVEGKERIGSAESAGSHDSINQEIHHFKPIKALPRTPLRTLDGRQMDPKLIRVLPILKRVSNAVPKPPTPTHLKKMFGCSWSAFKRISKQQQVLWQDSSNNQQQQETKKTDKKSEQPRTSKSSKTLQELEERNAEVAFDTNKNYTKNVNNKIINGTKVSKKLNMDEQPETGKQPGKRGRVKNGMILGKHKLQPNNNEKMIEVVDLDVEDRELMSANETATSSSDPLAFTPKCEPRPPSPVLELAMENIAERIKRRKTTRTVSNTENVQSAMNQVAPTERPSKAMSKKISSRGRKPKVNKTTPIVVQPKVKTKKIVKVTTVTSQIKRLAARSSKRPRYTEDSESEEELEEQRQLEANEEAELDRSNPNITPSPTVPSPLPIPPPAKKSRKVAKSTAKSKSKKQKTSKEVEQPPLPSPEELTTTKKNNHATTSHAPKEDEEVIREQERLERLAAQEREDRELALKLQAQFNAMERIAGRTRRGAARVPSPLLSK